MAALLASGSKSRAINYSWSSAADGNWDTTTNWTPNGVPVAADSVLFNAPSVNRDENIYLNGARAITLLTFANTGTTTLLGGVSGTPASNILTISGGITVNSGAGAVTFGSAAAAVPLSLTRALPFTNNASSLLTIASGVSLASTVTAATTLTVNGTGNTTFGGALSTGGGTGASLALTSSGTGTVTLAGANTYTGATTVTGGSTLSVTGSITSAVTATGSTFNLAGTDNAAVALTNSTFNVASTGSLTGAVTATTNSTVNLAGTTNASVTLNGSAYNVLAGGTMTGGNVAATVSLASGAPLASSVNVAGTIGGTGTVTVSSLVTGGSLVSSAFTLESTGAITTTGLTTINGLTANVRGAISGGAFTMTQGALNLDYSGTGTDASHLTNGAALTLTGVAVSLNGGTHTEVVGSTTLGSATTSGATTIAQAGGGASTLQMGTITRNVANTLYFAAPGVAAVTNANTNGILGAYAVVGSTTGTVADWAVTNGATTGITGFSGYTPLPASTTTSTVNYLAVGNATLAEPSFQTVNTLKIDSTTGTAASLTIAGDGGAYTAPVLTVGGNGLLYVGTDAYTITGGTIRSSGGTQTAAGTGELIINNYGTGSLTVGSGLSTGAMVKAGPGLVILNGTNAVSGNTYIEQGTLSVGASAVSPFGTSASTTMNIANGATLDISAAASPVAVNAINSTNIYASGNVTLGTNTLNIGSAAANGSFFGVISGSGNVAKVGASTQTLSGLSTYTGATTISGGGVLNVGALANVNTPSSIGAGSAAGAASDLVVNIGTLQYTGTLNTSTNRPLSIGPSATFDGSGTNGTTPTTYGTVSFTGTGAVDFVGNTPRQINFSGSNIGSSNGATLLSFSGQNTFGLQITDENATNTTSVTKVGAGTWTLSNGANSYSGGTSVTAGRLISTAAGSLGTGLVTVNGGSVLLADGGVTANNFSLTGGGPTFSGTSGGVSSTPGVLVLNNSSTASGTITISGSTRISAGVTYSDSITRGTITGQITGTGDLTIGNTSGTAGGALTLTNTTNNYTGNTTIVSGSTSGGSTTAVILGGSAVGSGGVIPHGAAAGNLVFNNGSTSGTRLFTLNGNSATINGLASAGSTAGTTQVTNNGLTAATLTFGDNNATASYTGTFTNTSTNALLPNTTATGTLGLAKIGSGTQSLLTTNAGTSTNSGSGYAGGTTINAGTLNLNFNGASAVALFNVIPANQPVTLAGGTLGLLGNATAANASTQGLSGMVLNPGSSGISLTSNGGLSTTLNMGAITRNTGSTLGITLPAAGSVTTTSTTATASGVLTSSTGTAYATVGGTTWAVIPATGATRAITGLATYNTNSFTASDNTDVTGTQAPGGFTASTLRFNTASATLDVSGAGVSTIATGGILVTAATAGANAVAINNSGTSGTGGGLSPGAGNELAVTNNGALTINAPITSGALTISGAGTTTLTALNTHTGTTTINGGVYTPGLVYTNAAGGTAALPVGTVYVNGGTFNTATPGASTSGLGTGALVVNHNGLLAGTGVVNNSANGLTTTINGGGAVSPGAAPAATGVLTLVSNVTFSGSTGNLSIYAVDVTATGCDLLRINGTLNLGSIFDQIVISGDPTASGLPSYPLITASGGITGVFESFGVLPNGYALEYTPTQLSLVSTTPIPEPGTWAAVVAALGLGVLGTRRGRAKVGLPYGG